MLENPVAIIDIGSNSVRLVVYAGSARMPSTLFNEKVMAGLGKCVASTGKLSDEAQERALGALSRFHILIRQMGVRKTRVVATAAVREASNGAEFMERVREIGFEPELLPGQAEGYLAGQGVLSGIPDADGVVGDLGGGSLELGDVGSGEVGKAVSLPFGVLRIGPLLAKGESSVGKKLGKAIDASGFRSLARGRPFYLVGGSWRSLARFDMALNAHPLPIVHQYEMPLSRPAELHKALPSLKAELKAFAALTSARVPTLPNAALLLKIMVDELKPSALIVSSLGIREGLLYEGLTPDQRARDPLIEAAREAGRGLGRFKEHGALLDRWIAPVFDDSPDMARLRLAACLLGDIAWAAHPDFRAERGVDMALHGNWVAVDAPGRVMIAQALFCNFGGGRSFSQHPVARLCRPDQLQRASLWGYAMRLGQRLSGGVAASLENSRLVRENGHLRLELRKGNEALFGEAVEKRLETLAEAMGVQAKAVAV